MADDRTYGFSRDDAASLLPLIGGGDSLYIETRPRGSQADTACILDGALPAATNAKTGAASATATVCEWDSGTSDYTETSDTVTVWNHSEATSFAEDTFGIARYVNGHLVFFGDCQAMASR